MTGSGSSALPSPTFGGDKPPDTYLGVAQHMLEGVRVLAAAAVVPVPALNLLAGHAAECLLKAYLTRDGSQKTVAAVTVPAIRHDLEALWHEAVRHGLALAPSPPPWVVDLNTLHNRPFPIRYLEGPAGRIQGMVGPNIDAMTTGLTALLDMVRAHLPP